MARIFWVFIRKWIAEKILNRDTMLQMEKGWWSCQSPFLALKGLGVNAVEGCKPLERHSDTTNG
jgi:hypothetical protein